MGIVGKLVGIGFFVIVVLVVVAYVPSVFDSVNEYFANVLNASLLVITPQAGEIVCDVRVKTNVSLTQDKILGVLDPIPLISDVDITIDPRNSHTFTYFNCVPFQQFVIANLLDGGIGQAPRVDTSVSDVPTNSFISVFGTKIIQQIRLVDVNDPNQKVDWILQPNLSYTTTLPDGILESPFSLNADYVVSNIPVRQYLLEIHVNGLGKGINGQPVGEPFIGQICNQFQTFSAGQCIPNP